jgi:uncharacterized membrane-anchored protein
LAKNYSIDHILKTIIALPLFAVLATCLMQPICGADKESTQSEASKAAAFEKKILSKYTWVRGPGSASMKDLAAVKVPDGYMFTDAQGTQDLLKMMGNPTSGKELGFLAVTNFFTAESRSWFVIYEFDEVGYVKDDEKDKLDADAMLKAIIKGNEYGNEERQKMGAAPLKISGWHTKPKYDAQTHNLEWAINVESEGHRSVNYNTRLLGRKGVMEVSLVTGPDDLELTLPIFKEQLRGYDFQAGQKYAEYKAGDKIAKYGLAALVIGGAAAGAAKLGLFAWLAVFLKKGWKLVVVAFVAIGAVIKRMLGFRAPRSSSE